MSATRDSGASGTAGFSLIEMLAVVAVLALLLGTVSARLPGSAGRMSTSAVAAETASLARLARERAVRTGQSTALRIDLASRTIAVEGARRIVVPAAIDVEVTSSAADVTATGASGVRFFPDGSSTGGTIRIGQPRAFHEVRINWFTGRVVVVPPA